MNKELVEDYNSGMTLRCMASKHKTSNKLLKQNLATNGIIYKDARYRVPGYNKDAFGDMTQELPAYFYGFMLGDGCLSVNKNGYIKSVVFGVNSKDDYILHKLKDYIGCNSNVTRRVVVKPSSTEMTSVSQFSFSDKEIINRLIDLGLSPRKSGKEIVPDCLKMDKNFWRGMIDADGCLSFSRKSRSFSIGLLSSEVTAVNFAEFCKTVVPNSNPCISAGRNGAIYSTVLSGQCARELAFHLYNDSSIHLVRKYEKSIKAAGDFEYLSIKRSNAQPILNSRGLWEMQVSVKVGAKHKTIRLGKFESKEAALQARDSFILQYNKETNGSHINSTSSPDSTG